MDMMERFEDWDGKRVADLRAVADALMPSDYADVIAACYADDTKTARAASWVLKAAYEAGADIAFPADILGADPHWEIALHLLQSIQHCAVDLPPEAVIPYLKHEKPMLRAWALDAYVRLGGSDSDTLLAAAANDPAASVRARARNLAKEQ
ncbi:HEAT repeat domain-containing protein [Yoonia sp. GPGPB17]|uniref:hypothetical protein n=1 Tax=Yoonia sp. GPGPB17 TaxID=3026147 RepID=UPI0030C12952